MNFFSFFCFFVFFLVLNSFSVNSLYLFSDEREICFEPNLEKEILYDLTSDKDETAEFYTSGNFSEYIKLDMEELFIEKDNHYTIVGSLSLPDKMEKEYETLKVGAKPKTADSTGVGIIMASAVRLLILKCWDEKHAMIYDLNIAISPNLTKFVLSIRNNGNEAISQALVQIDIYDYEKNKLMSFSPSIELLINEKKQVIGEYNGNFPPGKYTAEASLTYDGIESEQIEVKKFEIPDPNKVAAAAPKKPSSVTVAPTLFNQQNAAREPSSPGYNWMLYVVLPAAILVIVGIVFFLTRRKK